MAEHVFESEMVEEFYNSCHGPGGRFCGVGAKGKGISRVPMSAGARRSNALIRGNNAARKTKEYKGTVKAIKAMDSKTKKAAVDMTKGTRPSAAAMKLTSKYGTRQAPRAKKSAAAPAAAKPKATPKKEYGSGKTEPGALAITKRFAGTGGKKVTPRKPSSTVTAKADKYGSGKTEPSALEITKKYGTRRG